MSQCWCWGLGSVINKIFFFHLRLLLQLPFYEGRGGGRRAGGKRRNSSKLTFLPTKGKAPLLGRLWRILFFFSWRRKRFLKRYILISRVAFIAQVRKWNPILWGLYHLFRWWWAVCLLLQGPGKRWHRLGRRRSTAWLSIQGRGHGCGIRWPEPGKSFKSRVAWGLRNICTRRDSCKRACWIWKRFALCVAWDSAVDWFRASVPSAWKHG